MYAVAFRVFHFFLIQVSVGCQTINVYDLRYSENPFDCPMMLIGLGIGLGMLGIVAIAAICCYTYGKYWTQRNKQKTQVKQIGTCMRQSSYGRISRLLPWRYPRMLREEHPGREVDQEAQFIFF